MKNLSSTNVALSLICQWWLSEQAEWEPVVQTLAMREGAEAHAAIEAYIRGDKSPPELNLPRAAKARVNRKLLAWYDWVDDAAMASWRPEVTMAFDIEDHVARELPAADPRQPWKQYESVDRTREFTVKSDVVSMGEDIDGPFVEVIDWKFGRPNEEKDRAQVLAGCLAASRIAGVCRAVGRVVYISEDHVGPILRNEYDEFDLAAIGNRLARVFQEHRRARPSPGAHCKQMYCRAQKSCMKWRIDNEPTNERVSLPTISAEPAPASR